MMNRVLPFENVVDSILEGLSIVLGVEKFQALYIVFSEMRMNDNEWMVVVQNFDTSNSLEFVALNIGSIMRSCVSVYDQLEYEHMPLFKRGVHRIRLMVIEWLRVCIDDGNTTEMDITSLYNAFSVLSDSVSFAVLHATLFPEFIHSRSLAELTHPFERLDSIVEQYGRNESLTREQHSGLVFTMREIDLELQEVGGVCNLAIVITALYLWARPSIENISNTVHVIGGREDPSEH